MVIELLLNGDGDGATAADLRPGSVLQPRAEQFEAACRLADKFRGPPEGSHSTDMDLMFALQHYITGDMLVEFAMDVAWQRQALRPEDRLRRCKLPSDLADVWAAMVATAAPHRVSATVIRQTIPLPRSQSSEVRRCTRGLNR